MELRPYQQAALAAILQAMRQERYILAQAATGAGKTILFSALIKHCMETYKMRIGILAHREILVLQAYDKLLRVWPEGKDKIGIACASVSQAVELRKPVVIASPQTLARRLNSMPALDLLIIDECHRVPPKNQKSQYRDLLVRLAEYYPQMRVLGVTATPYRLGHGYIYGTGCRKGSFNWFPKMHCHISIAELQDQEYLVPLRAKQVEDIKHELKNVSTSKGEYNTGQLEALMGKECHLQSAVHAYQDYGEGRKHVVAFCVTIKHAELLCHEFERNGISATVVHSELDKDARAKALTDFENGEVRVICNVGVLTEGWDCTNVDCILFCRPTLSPALYVQMVGRGLRTHPGKKNCLLLDLASNCMTHGDVNDPIVQIPGGKDVDKEQHSLKECNRCGELYSRHLKCCPACGWEPVGVEKEIVDKADVKMKEINFASTQIPAKVSSWTMSGFTSKAGNYMARISLSVSAPECSSSPLLVTQYFDFEGNASLYGRDRARHDWYRLTGTEPPEDVAEALERQNEIQMPEMISIRRKDKYYNVARWSV